MKGNALVTGGAGYVGSVLVPKLIEKGYDVRVMDLMLFGDSSLKTVENDCEIVRGDLRNLELVKRCLQGVDVVVHLAAISNDPCSDLNPKLTYEVNFEATRSLVDMAKKEGVKRFIYASSSSVYGIKEESEVTENLSLEPITIYSQTKALSEEVVIDRASESFTPIVVRPATVCGYSPRQRLDVIVNILASNAINNGKITVFGGEQKRPNLHIEDMVDLYSDLLSASKEKISGEVFNYGGDNHTVNELANIVREVIGDNVTIEKIPDNNDPRSYSISSRKMKRVLGISPKKNVSDAVVDLKNAFSSGLINNPSDSKYRNIERMKELGFG